MQRKDKGAEGEVVEGRYNGIVLASYLQNFRLQLPHLGNMIALVRDMSNFKLELPYDVFTVIKDMEKTCHFTKKLRMR